MYDSCSFAVLFAPTDDIIAVVVVPILSPKRIGKATLIFSKPCPALMLAINL